MPEADTSSSHEEKFTQEFGNNVMCPLVVGHVHG